MNSVRTETLRINLTLNAEQSKKFDTVIRSLFKSSIEPMDGDTFKVWYEFNVNYFGDIVENFRRLRTILADKDVVRNVSMDELQHGESIIVNLLDELRKVKAAL